LSAVWKAHEAQVSDPETHVKALNAQVSALEKQLKEVYEEDLKKMERMAVEKDQIELLKARITEQDLMKNEANTVLKAQLEKALADSEASAKDKDKAEKENEELLKKLAKFEKDMAVGAQVCNTPSLLNCKIQL
jgi:chromosome segregation ATPase